MHTYYLVKATNLNVQDTEERLVVLLKEFDFDES